MLHQTHTDCQTLRAIFAYVNAHESSKKIIKTKFAKYALTRFSSILNPTVTQTLEK